MFVLSVTVCEIITFNLTKRLVSNVWPSKSSWRSWATMSLNTLVDGFLRRTRWWKNGVFMSYRFPLVHQRDKLTHTRTSRRQLQARMQRLLCGYKRSYLATPYLIADLSPIDISGHLIFGRKSRPPRPLVYSCDTCKQILLFINMIKGIYMWLSVVIAIAAPMGSTFIGVKVDYH